MSREWKAFLASGSVLELTKKLNEIEGQGFNVHSAVSTDLPDLLAWTVLAYRERGARTE